MSDLVEWLTNILDEDEAAAEGNGTIAWLTFREPDGTMRYTAVASGEPDDHWCVDGEERTNYASVRVVLDEHQMLADIAAKRAILELHQPSRPADTWYWLERECAECGHRWHRDTPPGTPPTVIGPEVACPTVRLLGTIYAARPGYDESWRP